MGSRSSIFVMSLVTAWGLSGCGDSASPHLGTVNQAYENIEQLQRDGVPTGEFSMTQFAIQEDGTIEFKYYTKGRPEDQKLIDPAIEQARKLTSIIRQQHTVKLTFVDGNPMMTLNDKPVGTGDIIKTVVLEK